MKNLMRLAVGVVLLAAAHNATAGGDRYVGVGPAFFDYAFKARGGGYDFDGAAMAVKFGYRLHNNFAVEARAGLTLTDGVNAPDFSADLRRFYGGYLRVGGGDQFAPYFLAGYTDAVVNVKIPSRNFDHDFVDDGPSYGVGFNFTVGNQVKFNFEHMNYLNTGGGENVDLTANSFQVVYNF